MTRHLTREAIRALSTVTDPDRTASLRPALHLMWAVSPETGKPVGRWIVGAAVPQPAQDKTSCIHPD